MCLWVCGQGVLLKCTQGVTQKFRDLKAWKESSEKKKKKIIKKWGSLFPGGWISRNMIPELSRNRKNWAIWQMNRLINLFKFLNILSITFYIYIYIYIYIYMHRYSHTMIENKTATSWTSFKIRTISCYMWFMPCIKRAMHNTRSIRQCYLGKYNQKVH